ncbi:alpha/beta fold hydrolase [Fructilactobacillus sp. Tb1]|uniref:alpha/beta fold hydrolase n=1 Tax=Fructilactobacillus sp. Tb1 TaxID=3422304 RepID=UPI003D2A55E2
MKFYTSDQVELDYDDCGAKNDPVIMILSGIGAYKESWKATVAFLVQHHYRVINLDARNQGKSEHTNKGLRISRHAVDLYELQQQLEIKNPILMGNSMGASTMFAYVSLFGSENINGIIDVDQSPKMINDTNWQFGFKNITWDDFYFQLQQQFGKSTFKNIDNQLFNEMQELKRDFPYDKNLNFPLLLDHATQDWRSIIINLHCPLLIVCGANSPYFNPQFGQVVSNFSDSVETISINDAGHLVMDEQPEKFNAVILEWLNKIDK